MKAIKIKKNDSNQRLDRFLGKLYPLMNKSLIQKYIRKKKIKVNKKKTENSYILQEKDIVNIYLYDEELSKYKDKKRESKAKIKLDIIYEDENILIVDKPKHILSHAASKRDYGNNVVDFVTSYLLKKKEYIPREDLTFRPAIINRLDYNTQGLIVACKNSKSLKILNDAIKENKIEKYYRAIVHGKISEYMYIDEALKKVNKNTVKLSPDGKISKTEIYPIKYSDKFSYLEIKLITGRTHQIRAHLSSIGHPILGDSKYGFNDKNINSQLLLAHKLVFKAIEGLEYLNNKEFKSNFLGDFDNLANKILK